MVNRLNPRDSNSPAHLEIRLLYGGAVHDQRYIVSVPATLGNRQGWYTVLRYNMTGRDNRLHRERRVWQDYPGIVSRTLAPKVELDVLPFKRRVRQLKELGLTESLEVGYRLSPRGGAVLACLVANSR